MNERARPTDPAREETLAEEPTRQAGPESLERVEERLVADVETVESGQVRMTKRVVEEPAELDVELRHSEVDLERQPADRPLEATERPVTQHDEETVILVIEERLETRKVPWVVEEIHLRRRTVTDTTRVADTVRKERWEMSTDGDVGVKPPNDSVAQSAASNQHDE